MKTILYLVAGVVLLYLLWKWMGERKSADAPMISTTQYARSEILAGGGGMGGGMDFSSFL